MTAYRLMKGAPGGPAVPAESRASRDPILKLLIEADLKLLGPAVDEFSGGVSPMTRYRLMSLPETSEAGCAARALSDHGRNVEAFDRWVFADEQPVAVALGAGTVPRERLDESEPEEW